MLASPAPTATAYSSPAPAPAPSPSNPTVYPSALPKEFTMFDLELLHLFVTQTLDQVIDFGTGIETFRTEVVKQAFIYPFLMHEILSLAALHLGTLHPERRAICQHASNAHAATVRMNKSRMLACIVLQCGHHYISMFLTIYQPPDLTTEPATWHFNSHWACAVPPRDSESYCQKLPRLLRLLVHNIYARMGGSRSGQTIYTILFLLEFSQRC
jgi:hypothetical protein